MFVKHELRREEEGVGVLVMLRNQKYDAGKQLKIFFQSNLYKLIKLVKNNRIGPTENVIFWYMDSVMDM